MQFEHINLVIKQLDRSLAFYRAAFPHWRIGTRGEGTRHGKPRTRVHFGDDYHYIALNEMGEGDNRDLTGTTSISSTRPANLPTDMSTTEFVLLINKRDHQTIANMT